VLRPARKRKPWSWSGVWIWLHRAMAGPAKSALASIMGRAVYLSASLPARMPEIPWPMSSAVKPVDVRLRDQENSVSNGSKNTPKDHRTSPMHIVAAKQAAAMNHP